MNCKWFPLCSSLHQFLTAPIEKKSFSLCYWCTWPQVSGQRNVGQLGTSKTLSPRGQKSVHEEVQTTTTKPTAWGRGNWALVTGTILKSFSGSCLAACDWDIWAGGRGAGDRMWPKQVCPALPGHTSHRVGGLVFVILPQTRYNFSWRNVKLSDSNGAGLQRFKTWGRLEKC